MRKKMAKIKPIETEYDDHGNPIHYVTKCNINPDKNIEVWMEYDYSKKKIDAHCTKLIIED